MAFTRHGHHIDGTVLDKSERPNTVARCGGPGMCAPCSREAAMYKKAEEVKPSKPPTEPGFYRYSGGAQTMIFLGKKQLSAEFETTDQLTWYVILDNGTLSSCSWAYIEQAFGVWDLIPIAAEDK